ncbi:Histone acetyltransferase ESA1 [Nakaseomyces bracarensis]|uniref:Histone acetyltransferase ESA1 n=1 Tax=Nakaseomyces bracarensis TaxID=273131 RepID=A0ABR4NVD5_9SACH
MAGASTENEEEFIPRTVTSTEEVLIKCQCWVEKDGEERLAEILSINARVSPSKFYVHYVNFNKRLDEWVIGDRINLEKEVLFPRPKRKNDEETGTKKKKQKQNKLKKGNTTPLPLESDAKFSEGGDNSDVMDLDNLNVRGLKDEDISREDEIKKLRTSGSMIQNPHEVAHVRNLSKIIMGKYEIEPWYFSPYPIELTDGDEVYIDDFTLQYFGSKKQYERYRKKCTLRHPPGNEIYRDDYVSFFEIDGRKQRTWCRNLCLLSKLFLDHKTLYYDVDPFLFYCMTRRDELGHHLVGYFSKEKESADGYNVACILTLPQYQRMGYGRLLIEFSYELSKKEGKVGSPEKPLSDLGLLSYRAYWSDVLITLLIEHGKEVTIDDISSMTSMTTTDILHTLKTLNILRYYKGQHIIFINDAILERYNKLKNKKRRSIDAEKLLWKPPIFTASQLRFAW